MTIRQARLADAPAIADIHVETWRNTYAGVLPDAYIANLSVKERLRFWRVILARNDHGMTIVAEDAQAGVIGFGNAGPARPEGMPADSDWDGEVYTLYLMPDWHGQGLGRLLLEGLFDELRSAKCLNIMLWVLEANPTRFFYEAMGGRLVARRREPFAGAMLDELAYGWRLNAGRKGFS